MGVDGCRGGWLVAWLEPYPGMALYSTFAEVFQATLHCPRVAVDMPIGLPRCGEKRACDALVRARLGPRRSSVFAAPWRGSLGCRDYAQVRTAGMSLQSFYLLPKVAEVDAALSPGDQQRVVECHPELIWVRLSGQPLSLSKKAPEGREMRRSLLGFSVPEWHGLRSQVQPDDVVDALGLALAATHQLQGGGWCFPELPQRDERGLRMEIWG